MADREAVGVVVVTAAAGVEERVEVTKGLEGWTMSEDRNARAVDRRRFLSSCMRVLMINEDFGSVLEPLFPLRWPIGVAFIVHIVKCDVVD